MGVLFPFSSVIFLQDEVMCKEGTYNLNSVKTNKEAERCDRPSSKTQLGLIHQHTVRNNTTFDGRVTHPVTQSYQSNNRVTQSYQSNNPATQSFQSNNNTSRSQVLAILQNTR